VKELNNILSGFVGLSFRDTSKAIQACATLGLKHRLHSTYEKSIVERAIDYVKDRTECFDDYYPCIKKECNL